MHVRIKQLVVLAAALAALVVGAGCGSEADEPKGSATTSSSSESKTIFGFLYAPRGFNSATKAWGNGFDQAQAELGSRFKVVLKSEAAIDLDPAHYLNFIRSGLIQKPDGIIVIPNNPAGMARGLQKIVDQTGVKLLAMDGPIPGVEQVGY